MGRLLVALVGVCLTVSAANTEPDIHVQRDGDRFLLDVHTFIPVEPTAILAALTDYDHLNRISPIITSSTEREPGVVEMNMHGCFLFFCFDKIQTQRIHVTPMSVFGRIMPDRSDYQDGWSLWLVGHAPGGARVVLHSQFTPDFWVPPLIGPLLIKRSMERQVLLSIKALTDLQAHSP